MKQRIEQFWTEAESLLNSDKKLIDKISEIENLIRERLERFELINYDAEFNLVKESGIENLANQQKEKIIKNIWNPLFNEATTFKEYSYLLNWVIPDDFEEHLWLPQDHHIFVYVYNVFLVFLMVFLFHPFFLSFDFLCEDCCISKHCICFTSYFLPLLFHSH